MLPDQPVPARNKRTPLLATVWEPTFHEMSQKERRDLVPECHNDGRLEHEEKRPVSGVHGRHVALSEHREEIAAAACALAELSFGQWRAAEKGGDEGQEVLGKAGHR